MVYALPPQPSTLAITQKNFFSLFGLTVILNLEGSEIGFGDTYYQLWSLEWRNYTDEMERIQWVPKAIL